MRETIRLVESELSTKRKDLLSMVNAYGGSRFGRQHIYRNAYYQVNPVNPQITEWSFLLACYPHGEIFFTHIDKWTYTAETFVRWDMERNEPITDSPEMLEELRLLLEFLRNENIIQ